METWGRHGRICLGDSYLEALVQSGYVVLRVARRGYCGSEGKSLPAYAIRQVDGYRPNAHQVLGAIQAESADLRVAFEFMSTHPHVDASRVVVGGLSTGGLASLLAAAREPRFRAVVSMAGGFAWTDGGQVTSRAILTDVWRDLAKDLTMPVMILWSVNDVELEPTVGESLANALRCEQRRVEHITYPPFRENGHLLFPIRRGPRSSRVTSCNFLTRMCGVDSTRRITKRSSESATPAAGRWR